MGRTLSLLDQTTSLIAHNRDGSTDTQKARRSALSYLAKTLSRDFKLKNLENLKQKHVEHVVQKWKEQNSNRTMGNKMSHVRWLAEKLGKQTMIPRSNAEVGLEPRKIDYNTDKSWSPSESLKNDLPEVQRLHVMLMRDFGMRFQEAAKFRPEENIQGDRIDIVYGTKGGRDRDFEFQYEKDLGERRQFDINERQRETIQKLNQYLERQNVVSLSRMFEKYKNFVNNTRNEYKKAGITKEGVGTPHGLRHAYAQERYKDLTGWKPPSQLTDAERRAFRASMSKESRELDRSVRLEISHELGHGRTQVSSNYIGSWRS